MSAKLNSLDHINKLLVGIVNEFGPISARDVINGFWATPPPPLPRAELFDLGDDELKYRLYYLVVKGYITCEQSDYGPDMFSPLMPQVK
jgi:hypothetical protein